MELFTWLMLGLFTIFSVFAGFVWFETKPLHHVTWFKIRMIYFMGFLLIIYVMLSTIVIVICFK